MRRNPKKGKRAKRRQRRIKRACFEEGPRFSGAKHTETGWADGVFLHHAGRKDFFDTLKARQQPRFFRVDGFGMLRPDFVRRISAQSAASLGAKHLAPWGSYSFLSWRRM